jgi:Zn-dependent peptidase ImmA (M78 family)/DNA-binding XRE family transcriptional regulator
VEAREARSLTGVALADLLGVSRQTITQYEKDQQTPRPAVMLKITQVLNLPMAFFLREPTHPLSGVIFARSMAAATRAPRKRAERRHEWARQIAEWLKSYLDFPPVDFPDFKPAADPTIIPDEWIEQASEKTRRHWRMGDGPISNVIWLLEQHGVVPSFSDFGSEDLDAFSDCGRTSYSPHISLSSEKKFAARVNYTVAHELGHLVVHRNVPEHVAKRKSEHALIEHQANVFAGAFLLPASTFAPLVRYPSLEMFRTLKAFWRVSIGALLMRAKSLSLIEESKFTNLWIAYNKRGWKHVEPMDDELQFGSPKLLRQSFDLLVNERVVSRQEIRSSLPYDSADVEKLCGLDEGFLSDDFGANIVTLPQNRRRPSGRVGGKIGDVLPFDRSK